jgi:adenylylsulfate kinase-like enzyme
MVRLWYNYISAAGATSLTLTNAEKQARYRERHLGVDGEKVRVGLNLNAGTREKMGRLARHRGYTITALVEELVERAEQRVTARLPSRALKAYYDTE